MKSQIRFWSITNGKLDELSNSSFSTNHKEKDLEDWVYDNPSLLGSDLTVLGRQIFIPKVGYLDLLAVRDDGRLVVVEFKREQSTRDAIAQILDYASSISLMKIEDIRSLSNFNVSDETEILNVNPEMLLVAADADDATQRIVDYLGSAALKIEVVTFSYVSLQNGQEILARTISMPPEVAPASERQIIKINQDEIFEIATQRGVLTLVEKLHEAVRMGWSVEMFPTAGGKLRYWAKTSTDKWKVLFGIYVGGEKFSTPTGQLDAWVRPETVAELTNLTSDAIRKQLTQFSKVNETTTMTVVRLKTPAEADALFHLLESWRDASRTS